MVALQDGVFMSQRYWKPIKIPRVCLLRLQPLIATEHDAIGWTCVHRKSVKVKVNTLMNGQWALAT